MLDIHTQYAVLRSSDSDDIMTKWEYPAKDVFYSYGAAFLEMINQRLQRDFSIGLVTLLAGWYSEKRLTATTTEDFLSYVQNVTGAVEPWSALFDDWVYRAPCPTILASDFSYLNGVAEITLSRPGGGNQLVEDLDVVFDDGERLYWKKIDLPFDAGNRVTAQMPWPPTRVMLDPDLFYVFRLEVSPDWIGPPVGLAPRG